MADVWDRQSPPRLVGYKSWLYQMPCIDSSGDMVVSVPLAEHSELHRESPSRWLVAVGDVSGRGEAASRLNDALATRLIRLVGKMTDPASIIMALNDDPIEPNRFACLLVAVIDSDRHELTIANAGFNPPLIRRVGRQVESLAEEISWYPLWILPEQPYENAIVPIAPGEVVIFHSDSVTAVIDHQEQLFGLKSLQRAIAQAPHGAASVGQSILEAIRRFAQGRAQQGDITLLCLERAVPTTLPGRKVSG